MPAVRIEAKAWDDPRFKLLAKAIGKEPMDALIRVAWLWSLCTEENTSKLNCEIVDAHVGIDGFAELLVACHLAERSENNRVRIKGASSDRIGWLTTKRKNGRKGGLAKAKQTPSERLAIGTPLVNPIAPALANAPALALTQEQEHGKELDAAGAATREAARVSRSKPAPSEPALGLAAYLLAGIRSHSPDHPCTDARLTDWARDLDLAIRVDKRTEGQVRTAIEFAHRDVFWRSVVLSGAKTRKHCTALLAKAKQPALTLGRSSQGRVAQMLAEADELERQGQ